MNDVTSSVRQKLRSSLADLQTLRDEIRLKLHLMGMDAKDAMRDLEPRIDRIEHEVEHAGDDAVGRIATALERIVKSLRALRERHVHAS